MGYLYIATPYGSEDPNVVKIRTEYATRLNRYLHQCGIMAYVPVAYTTIDLDQNIPEDHWYDFGLAMLEHADALIVVQLPGWEQSKGIELEKWFADKNGIVVRHSTDSFLDVVNVCRRMVERAKRIASTQA